MITDSFKKAIDSFYQKDRTSYLNALSVIEAMLEEIKTEREKTELTMEYLLCCSLSYLASPNILCKYYGEAAEILSKNGSFVFAHLPSYLPAEAYGDLVEFYGVSSDKADATAEELERAIKLASKFSSAAAGTDLMYRAEIELKRGDAGSALAYASKAVETVPENNIHAVKCAGRLFEKSKAEFESQYKLPFQPRLNDNQNEKQK